MIEVKLIDKMGSDLNAARVSFHKECGREDGSGREENRVRVCALFLGAGTMNYDVLIAAVKAVEENNKINGASWADWQDADHILETYEIDGADRDVIEILNRAIATNGQSLAEDLPKAERREFGQNFYGSFAYRIAEHYSQSDNEAEI